MHMCTPVTITPTPEGLIVSTTAAAISLVILSWFWGEQSRVLFLFQNSNKRYINVLELTIHIYNEATISLFMKVREID